MKFYAIGATDIDETSDVVDTVIIAEDDASAVDQFETFVERRVLELVAEYAADGDDIDGVDIDWASADHRRVTLDEYFIYTLETLAVFRP